MPDYNRYRFEKDISNNDIINTLKAKFPKYQKSTMTMVNNPYDYAVQLLPEAEALLVEAYGTGQGLTICEKRRSRNHGNKKKPCRLYVRLDNALMDQVKTLMEKMHFATVQDFVEAAIAQMVTKYGGAA
jgi:hypothetical protein